MHVVPEGELPENPRRQGHFGLQAVSCRDEWQLARPALTEGLCLRPM